MEENNFEIKFTPIAYSDLDDIYGYIVNELFNKEAADNLLDKMENSIMRLRYFPYSCNFVSDQPLMDKGYRKLLIENYIVFHIVNEQSKEVVVMRVLYNKQNYQGFL